MNFEDIEVAYKFHTEFEKKGFYWNLEKKVMKFKSYTEKQKIEQVKSLLRHTKIKREDYVSYNHFIENIDRCTTSVISLLKILSENNLYTFTELEKKHFTK